MSKDPLYQAELAQERIKRLEDIVRKYLATADASVRSKKHKLDLTDCDDLARAYFAEHGNTIEWPGRFK